MTIRTPVAVYECDGPSCSSTATVDLPTPRVRRVAGWWRLDGHEEGAEPWVFCSKTCLHRWTSPPAETAAPTWEHRHRSDGTLCVAGHDPDTLECAEGHGRIYSTATSYSTATDAPRCAAARHGHGPDGPGVLLTCTLKAGHDGWHNTPKGTQWAPATT